MHATAAFQTWSRSRAARAQGYRRNDDLSFSWASRTMRYGGVLLLIFVVYHLLHFTTGTLHHLVLLLLGALQELRAHRLGGRAPLGDELLGLALGRFDLRLRLGRDQLLVVVLVHLVPGGYGPHVVDPAPDIGPGREVAADDVGDAEDTRAEIIGDGRFVAQQKFVVRADYVLVEDVQPFLGPLARGVERRLLNGFVLVLELRENLRIDEAVAEIAIEAGVEPVHHRVDLGPFLQILRIGRRVHLVGDVFEDRRAFVQEKAVVLEHPECDRLAGPRYASDQNDAHPAILREHERDRDCRFRCATTPGRSLTRVEASPCATRAMADSPGVRSPTSR